MKKSFLIIIKLRINIGFLKAYIYKYIRIIVKRLRRSLWEGDLLCSNHNDPNLNNKN
jgi:hypothetical protein